jgi:hypothetical protein
MATSFHKEGRLGPINLVELCHILVIIYNRVTKIFILCFQVELTGRNDDDIVIIYNRVPKTGSTSFAGIAYDLCSKNKFHVLHVNTTKNIHVLPLSVW